MKFIFGATIFFLSLMTSLNLLADERFTPITATHYCLTASQKGIAFNYAQKRAWKITGDDAKVGIEIKILPKDFHIYRCPGCYSFSGTLDLGSGQTLVEVWTYLDTLRKKMWMRYDQTGTPEDTYGMMLLCHSVE